MTEQDEEPVKKVFGWVAERIARNDERPSHYPEVSRKGSATDFSLFRGGGSIGFLFICDPYGSRQSRDAV
jgi:hypothetical protein